jgi:PKHD-type hydroxylase
MSQPFHRIPGLLKPDELSQLESLLASSAFQDGKQTASLAARDVKNNQQLDRNDPSAAAIQALLWNAVSQSPYFQVAAQPKDIYPFIISQYAEGQYYGWHVDSPLMGETPLRTDLAMTIFLSDPASYDGGELVINGTTGPVAFKPEKGDAILYPCQYLHCVNEVKRGVRRAAITWIQSQIRSSEQRQILFELNQVHALMSQKDSQAPETQQLLQTYSNLFRMWAEL